MHHEQLVCINQSGTARRVYASHILHARNLGRQGLSCTTLEARRQSLGYFSPPKYMSLIVVPLSDLSGCVCFLFCRWVASLLEIFHRNLQVLQCYLGLGLSEGSTTCAHAAILGNATHRMYPLINDGWLTLHAFHVGVVTQAYLKSFAKCGKTEQNPVRYRVPNSPERCDEDNSADGSPHTTWSESP